MIKKLLAVLLLAAATVNADIGVVGSKSGVVVAKEIYAGDNSKLSQALSARTAADPTLTFQTFTLPDASFDAVTVPLDQAPLRSGALSLLNDPAPDSKFVRAVLLVILDEVNTIRTNPALGLAPRTAAQMRTAIQSKLNAGAAD